MCEHTHTYAHAYTQSKIITHTHARAKYNPHTLFSTSAVLVHIDTILFCNYIN